MIVRPGQSHQPLPHSDLRPARGVFRPPCYDGLRLRELPLATVLSVFGLEPKRIGGTEMYARELSRQLGEAGWNSRLCFEAAPAPAVARFLDAPNTSVQVLPGISSPTPGVLRRFADLMRERPEIVHLAYTPFLSLYPLLARTHGVRKVYRAPTLRGTARRAPRCGSAWRPPRRRGATRWSFATATITRAAWLPAATSLLAVSAAFTTEWT